MQSAGGPQSPAPGAGKAGIWHEPRPACPQGYAMRNMETLLCCPSRTASVGSRRRQEMCWSKLHATNSAAHPYPSAIGLADPTPVEHGAAWPSSSMQCRQPSERRGRIVCSRSRRDETIDSLRCASLPALVGRRGSGIFLARIPLSQMAPGEHSHVTASRSTASRVC